MNLKATLALLALLIASPVLAERPPAEWVTLGTSGGPAVRAERSQIANALVVGNSTYLFDAGNGVQRQMALAGLSERNVKAIFLSHHHLDHNADLGPLIITHWTFGQGVLKILGPIGTRTLVNGLAAANAPTVLAAFPTGGAARPALSRTVSAFDVPASITSGVPIYSDDKIKVWAIGVDHFNMQPSVRLKTMPQALGFRVEAGGRTFVYTGDTGPSARMTALAKDADVLITEVVDVGAIRTNLEVQLAAAPKAVRDGIIAGMAVNHLTPSEIGKMAQAARVRSVVLTHFVPSPEDVGDRTIYAREIAVHYTGPVRLANDLDRF